MGIVAVAARDAARVHLALHERAPVVHLVALLAVGMVERRGEQRRAIVVQKRLSGFVSFGDLAASRMALRAISISRSLVRGCDRSALPVAA